MATPASSTCRALSNALNPGRIYLTDSGMIAGTGTARVRTLRISAPWRYDTEPRSFSGDSYAKSGIARPSSRFWGILRAVKFGCHRAELACQI
jgi:hypothetical protein